MAERSIGALDMADLTRLLREAVKQIAGLAEDRGLDPEHPTVWDLSCLLGVLIEVEHRISPTYVNTRDEQPQNLDEDVDDPYLRDVLLAVQRLTTTLPPGRRPADAKEARAVRKARNEHIHHDLLGYVRGPLVYAERQDEQHYLYLMRQGDWLKFGRGTFGRVRSYAPPVEIVEVRTAAFQDVKQAEDVLKARHRRDPHPAPGEAPRSFGKGSEVVPATVGIDLANVLPHGADVTATFEEFREARLTGDRSAPTRRDLGSDVEDENRRPRHHR